VLTQIQIAGSPATDHSGPSRLNLCLASTSIRGSTCHQAATQPTPKATRSDNISHPTLITLVYNYVLQYIIFELLFLLSIDTTPQCHPTEKQDITCECISVQTHTPSGPIEDQEHQTQATRPKSAATRSIDNCYRTGSVISTTQRPTTQTSQAAQQSYR
jgi:hypothetical protein